MRPRPKIRKWTRVWSATAFVLILAAWVGSGFWTLAYASREWGVGTMPGCVTIAQFANGVPPAKIGFTFRPAPPEGAWSWKGGYVVRMGSRSVSVPLWMPAVCAAMVFAWAWGLEVQARIRARLPMCAACGYDRAELKRGAVCPECGAKPGSEVRAG